MSSADIVKVSLSRKDQTLACYVKNIHDMIIFKDMTFFFFFFFKKRKLLIDVADIAEFILGAQENRGLLSFIFFLFKELTFQD